MISKAKYNALCKKTIAYLEESGIILTDAEKTRIEVADFGLNDVESIGLQIFTYINTERVCAKELILLPQQICPEHRHPTINGVPGKEETFRCRKGVVYLYVPGEPTPTPSCKLPPDAQTYFTSWHEIKLSPGDQYTLYPDTLHWFQAGDEGALITEFSTRSSDDADIFTDPRIVRAPVIEAGMST